MRSIWRTVRLWYVCETSHSLDRKFQGGEPLAGAVKNHLYTHGHDDQAGDANDGAQDIEAS
ncbi:hypothetical protein ACFL6U_29810 [Planctomycetota bacterium]